MKGTNMFIKKAKYHSDISAAYTRGLEQGFELARKLNHIRESKQQESSCFTNAAATELEESSLLGQQLVDIVNNRGVKLE